MNLRFGQIGRTLGLTISSRAIGIAREFVIAFGFGLSHATDGFYQLSAVPTYFLNYLVGPFSTAYIAWSNDPATPSEREHLPMISRFVLVGGGIVGLLFGLVTVVLALVRGGTFLDISLGLTMAMACLGTALTGLATAVSNARSCFGQAQGMLLINNLAFVVLIGLAAVALPGSRVEPLLVGAFCLAAVVAAAFSCKALGGHLFKRLASKDEVLGSAAVKRSVKRDFLPMLGYASIESGGFLATSAFVLLMASQSGSGVTSAASLAQRLCLTANGLLTNPLSNIAMVRLTQRGPRAQRRFLVRVTIATISGLSVIALTLVVGRSLLPLVLGGRGRFSADNAALLSSLIPGYALWLVAQGASMMLSRLSFARRRARVYTIVTTGGYVAANLVRFVAWRSNGFPVAVAAGALTEMVAAIVVLVFLASEREQSHVPPFEPDAELLNAPATSRGSLDEQDLR